MKTKKRFRTSAIAQLLSLSAVLSMGTLAAVEPPRPNIVVFLADDLGWGHVGWQNPKVKTPNLDRLAVQGVRLDQHYVACLCSPSRVAFNTGRYWSRFGCNSWTDAPQVMPTGTETVASALKSVGYRTGMVGKWHIGTGLDFGPEAFGFEYYYGIRRGGCTPLTHKWRGVGDSVLYRNKQIVEEPGHVTDLFAREAVKWIGSEKGRPFFLYLAFTSPHVPLLESARWMDLYKESAPDQSHQLYWAAISHLDDAVGQVVAEVERLGQRENTLFIFLSDNGAPGQGNLMQVDADKEAYLNVILPGECLPFRGHKGQLYEGGIRTPALVNWSGHLKPGVCATPLHVSDWMPTLCALGGYKATRDLKWDGTNIYPILAGESPAQNRVLYSKNLFGLNRDVIEDPWKLIITKEGEQELYNLAEDVGEKHNCASEHPEVVQRLLADMKAAAVRDDDANPNRVKKASQPTPAQLNEIIKQNE